MKRIKHIILLCLFMLLVTNYQLLQASDDNGASSLHTYPLPPATTSASQATPFSHNLFTEEERVWLQRHPVLTAGHSLEFKPILIKDNNNQHHGIIVDLYKILEQRLGVKINIVDNNWAATMRSLADKKLDIIPLINRQIAEKNGFLIAPAPFNSFFQVYARDDQNLNIKSLQDLKGKRVTYQKSIKALDAFLADYSDDISFISVPDVQEGIRRVQDGKADAFIGFHASHYYLMQYQINNIQAIYTLNELQVETVTASRSDEPLLLSILTKAINSLTYAERKAISEKWLGKSTLETEMPTLTAEERDFLSGHPVFSICDQYDVYPVSGVQDGHLIGIMGKISEAVTKKLNITLNAIAVHSGKELEENIAQGRCDLVSSVVPGQKRFPTITSSNTLLSLPYLSLGNLESVFFDQFSDFAGHTFIVRFKAQQQLFQKAYPSVKIEVINDIETIVKRVSKNSFVHFIGTRFVVERVIQQYGYTNLKVNGTFDKAVSPLAFGVHEDLPLLVTSLNKAIDQLDPYLLSSIADQYRTKNFTIVKSYNRYLLYILLVLALMILLSLAFIMRLKQQQKTIEAQRARFKTLMEHASDGILLVDHDGKILEANKKIQDMLGYSEKEIKALPIHELNRNLTRTEVKNRISAIIEHQKHFAYETEHIRKDGTLVPVGITATRIMLNNQPCVYSSIRDISEKAKYEQELKDSEFRWKFAIEGSRDGLWDWDVKTSKVFYSPQWKNMLGYSEEEIGQTLDEWENRVHPHDLEAVKQDMRNYFAGHTDIYNNRHRVLCKDGSFKWIQDRGVIVARDDQGQPLRLIGTQTDISDQIAAEQIINEAMHSAQAANQAKSVFLSNMSHELRTPLNAILGYSQLFAEDSNLTAKQRSGINTIHNAAEHLLLLINDILDLSKIEAGRLDLHPAEFELAPFLKNICAIFRVRSDEKNLTFICEQNATLPAIITADELRLRQILLNLLSNAVKFTDHGFCSLQVAATPCGPTTTHLTFTIKDSGPGIAADKQSEVFIPFTQIGERLKHSQGSGLGLNICSKLVSLMNSKLVLTSPLYTGAEQKYGPGSQFSFTLEVPAIETTQAKQTIENTYEYELGKIKPETITALIVDDQPSNRNVLRDTLEPWGFRVTIAEGGHQVLQACEQQTPDIIFMDIFMPETDGFQATEQLKNNPLYAAIPVVAITASPTEASALKAKCLNVGFSDFLTKPFNQQDLIMVLARLLNLPLVEHSAKSPSRTPPASPPQHIIKQIRDYLDVGNIDAILTLATELETSESGRYREFATQLNQYASHIQFQAIEHLLDISVQRKEEQ